MTLVERLVRCPSPSGHEGNVARLLVAEMAARGLRVRIDEAGNAVGISGHGATQVYLVGHMDTVPGDLPVLAESGLLHGRGSVDAKGSLAAFVEAAAAVEESSALTLTVIGCVEEEAESRGARHVMEAYPTPDLVVIGEPSGWDAITIGYKGSALLRYALSKACSHRGAPPTTPAEDAVSFYREVCDAHPQRGPEFAKLSLNLVSINTSQDGVRERVDLSLDVRTPVGFNLGAFQRTVTDLAGAADVDVREHVAAVLSSKRNALVRALLGGIRSQEGRPRFKCKTGTSDMNLLQVWGCPIVAYGPGDSALDHTPDEHLDLADYERACAVLTHGLRSLAC